MKIHGSDLGKVSSAKTKRAEVKGGNFKALLHSQLDSSQSRQEHGQAEEHRKHAGSTIGLIEDATLILDEALDQIQQDGQPSEETARSLAELRDQLKQRLPDSDNLRAADAIIAVETGRLQSWKL